MNACNKNFQRSTFICGSCGAVFSASIDDFTIEDGINFARCPACDKLAAEAWYCVNLRSGADKKCGPTTAAGKQRASRNRTIHGHYTNSYLFPRKPGEYPECDHCQDMAECESDRSGYCHRKIEIYNKYLLAVKSGDPDKIRDLVAGNFAGAQQLINHLLRDCFKYGTAIEEPIVARDEDGNPIIVDGVYNLKANPSVGKLTDLMTRLGMTLIEFGITPKGQKERELLQGHLEADAADRSTTTEYRKKHSDRMARIFDEIKDAQRLRTNDERTKQILTDHNSELATDAEADAQEENDGGAE